MSGAINSARDLPVKLVAYDKRISLLLIVKCHGYLLVAERELVDWRLFLDEKQSVIIRL